MKQTMNILYATDGSFPASAATQLLPTLALPPNTRVLVATVIREPARPESLRHPDAWDRLMEQMRLEEYEAATDLLARTKRSLIEKNLAARGVYLETLILEGNVPQEIVTAARNLEIDLIVLGSRRLSGFLSVLLGSVARRVVEIAPCPVLLARPTPRGLQRALLAVDGSPQSREAVRVLREFPLPAEAEVTVLSVAQPIRLPLSELLPPFRRKVRQDIAEVEQAQVEIAQKLAEEARLSLEKAGRTVQALALKGDPAQTVVRVARQVKADLVVVGSRGLSGVKALMVGSVTYKVLEYAPCSVLVARPRVESASDRPEGRRNTPWLHAG